MSLSFRILSCSRENNLIYVLGRTVNDSLILLHRINQNVCKRVHDFQSAITVISETLDDIFLYVI